MNFDPLLRQLIATNNPAAVLAGIKHLRAYKQTHEFTPSEWSCIYAVAGQFTGEAATYAKRLLKEKPHKSVAHWD